MDGAEVLSDSSKVSVTTDLAKHSAAHLVCWCLPAQLSALDPSASFELTPAGQLATCRLWLCQILQYQHDVDQPAHVTLTSQCM